MNKNSEKKISIRRVLGFLRGVISKTKRKFISIIVARIVTSVVPMILPLYYGNVVDTIAGFSGVINSEVVEGLLQVLRFILLWHIIDFIARRVVERGIVTMETRNMKDIYDQCFTYLHKHSYSFFANSFGGALVKKVNKLVRGYETIVDVVVFQFIIIISTIIVTLYIVRNQHNQLGRLFTIRLFIFAGIQYVMRKKILPYDIASQEQDSRVTAYLADTITNHYNISTFSSLKRESHSFGVVTEKRRKLTFQTRRKRNRIFAANGIIMSVLEISLRYFMITLRAKGMLSVGMILVLQIYVFRLFDKIFMIGDIFKRTFQAVAESAEMIEILDTPLEVQDKSSDNIHIIGGQVSFDAIDFSYDVQGSLFQKFSLKIKPHEKVALVGPSGSGKSTIIKLIMRFMDVHSGKICIDGQDISQVTQESLRDAISVVPQDPILFHRSLKDNIMYGKPGATMEEIIHASTLAHCHEFITALPQGYDTLVGERGIKLSGGERQRVAIARAILENRQILILDEATSSLDSESEKLIQDAIHELIQSKTAIVVAHRLSTIREMDRIIVMDDGRIVEQGTHSDLLKTNGLYQKLRKIQSE